MLFVHLCKIAHCTLLLIAMLVNLLIMEREALDFNDIAVFLGYLDLVVSLRVGRRFFIAYAIWLGFITCRRASVFKINCCSILRNFMVIFWDSCLLARNAFEGFYIPENKIQGFVLFARLVHSIHCWLYPLIFMNFIPPLINITIEIFSTYNLVSFHMPHTSFIFLFLYIYLD